MLNGLIIEQDGTKLWYKDDKLHREDGPAVKHDDGRTRWFLNGRLHRADGPALERVDGSTEWWYKGIYVGSGYKPDPELWTRLTSTDANGGPLLNGCFIDLYKTKYWYKDDKKHREDGPAVEFPDGSKSWYFYGKFLNDNDDGFWKLWDRLTDEQRGNPNLLRYLPQ
jgi:hypothetical protein